MLTHHFFVLKVFKCHTDFKLLYWLFIIECVYLYNFYVHVYDMFEATGCTNVYHTKDFFTSYTFFICEITQPHCSLCYVEKWILHNFTIQLINVYGYQTKCGHSFISNCVQNIVTSLVLSKYALGNKKNSSYEWIVSIIHLHDLISNCFHFAFGNKSLVLWFIWKS